MTFDEWFTRRTEGFEGKVFGNPESICYEIAGDAWEEQQKKYEVNMSQVKYKLDIAVEALKYYAKQGSFENDGFMLTDKASSALEKIKGAL